MGFKEKLSKYYTDSYLEKYGDRLTQFQGSVLSVKLEEKTILWIFHKLSVTLMVRPDRSRVISKCVYNKNKWFKKATFVPVKQGNNVIIQGLKTVKDGKEFIEISNVLNLTIKQDLVPVDHSQLKKTRQQQTRMR
ncbi:hypothetical protein [Clostridium mediterraneense]|uniref:hypothetical protein n=1 Tax=Clostridium mediterraneense TaxID=1805472 RepID=UPI00082DB8A3|nr:hypothetical protein [Clostridium mediterraneense]